MENEKNKNKEKNKRTNITRTKQIQASVQIPSDWNLQPSGFYPAISLGPQSELAFVDNNPMYVCLFVCVCVCVWVCLCICVFVLTNKE